MQPRNPVQKNGEQGRAIVTDSPPHPVDIFREELRTQRNVIAHLIPKKIRGEFPPERIMVIAVLAYQAMLANVRENGTPPDIYSTIDSVVKMAQLGLVAGTDQAYLVPYKGKVQAIIGPRGLIDLSLRHPKMRACKAEAVLEGDIFDHDLGNDTITHKVGRGRSSVQSERAESLQWVWAKYTMTNGGESVKVLTREDVEFYRSFSAAKNAPDGPWVKNYEGMARKTALKRLLAYAPRDAFLSLALIEDDAGTYAPGLTTQDIAASLDSEGNVLAQVPTANAMLNAARVPVAPTKAPDAAPSKPTYGDDAENFPRE